MAISRMDLRTVGSTSIVVLGMYTIQSHSVYTHVNPNFFSSINASSTDVITLYTQAFGGSIIRIITFICSGSNFPPGSFISQAQGIDRRPDSTAKVKSGHPTLQVVFWSVRCRQAMIPFKLRRFAIWSCNSFSLLISAFVGNCSCPDEYEESRSWGSAKMCGFLRLNSSDGLEN